MPVDGWLCEETRQVFASPPPPPSMPAAQFTALQVAPDRPYRLWLTNGPVVWYIDYSRFLNQFPDPPAWDVWSQVRVSESDRLACLPDGLTLPLPRALDRSSIPKSVRVITEGGSQPYYYRPLYDASVNRNSDLAAEFSLSGEEIFQLSRDYAVPESLINQRLLDLVSCFRDYLAAEFSLSRRQIDYDRDVDARQAFQRYLCDPLPSELLQIRYATRLELIQAGGIRFVEDEWLGGRPVRMVKDDAVRVKVREL